MAFNVITRLVGPVEVMPPATQLIILVALSHGLIRIRYSFWNFHYGQVVGFINSGSAMTPCESLWLVVLRHMWRMIELPATTPMRQDAPLIRAGTQLPSYVTDYDDLHCYLYTCYVQGE